MSLKLRIEDNRCVNSLYKASWLKGECECIVGCKIKIQVMQKGHSPYTYIVTEDEYNRLCEKAVQESFNEKYTELTGEKKEMKLPEYVITNIEKGEGDFRSKILYASVYKNGKEVCSATLDFILLVYWNERDNVVNYYEALSRFVHLYYAMLQEFKDR